MTADERYNLIRIKIERAKEHVRNLEAEIRSFSVTNPYVVGTKRDPQTRKLIYYLVSVRETPSRLATITGDALHNLRSALDHLVYHLIIVGGGTPDRQSAFPITNTPDPAQYKANRTRKVAGMKKSAIDAIDALKPYQGGNDILWRLSELNNVDKHRLLITIGAHYRSMNFAPVIQRLLPRRPSLADQDIVVPDVFFRVADNLFPLQAGNELFTDLPDAEVNQKMEFRFEIAFGEPRIIEGKPVLDTLREIADVVENIVLSFKPLLA